MGLEKHISTEGESAPADGGNPHLRLLVERAPVAMGIVSRKGVIEYANPTLERVFGKDLAAAGDLIEFVQIGSPGKTEAKRALAFWQDELLGKRSDESEPEPFRGRVVTPEGIKEVVFRTMILGDKVVAILEDVTDVLRAGELEEANRALVRDIAERKKIENDLRRSNAELEQRVAVRAAALDDRMARYLSLLNASVDMIMVVDAKGRIIEINDAAVEYLGYSREELLSMSHTDLQCDVPPEERAKVREQVIAGRAVNTFYRLTRKDGSSFPAEVTISPGEADGEPVALAGVRDITKRMAAAEALRESEERFRKLSDAASEGIGVTQEGLIVDVNQRLADTLGYAVDEMIGRPALEFIAPDYRELVAHNMGVKSELPYEADFLRKDGSSIRMGGRGVPTSRDGREARVTALRDLTEERRLEAELAEQRVELARIHKLAMLSEVSAGIIHQISQPLSAIGNNVAATLSSLRSDEHPSPGALAPLENTEQDLMRLRQVIKRLRALAHPGQQNRVMLDLNRVVREAIGLAGNAARRGGVRFEVSLAPERPQVCADAIQLGQAFLNLLQNSIDALASCVPKRRRIEIVTRACDGAEVEVQVRDAGPGIAPDVQARLFEPLFTTKPEGTGIGLSLTHTIVAAHDGRVEGYNNEDGIGATFRVVIPIAKRDRQ